VGICSDGGAANLWKNRHNPTMKHSLTLLLVVAVAALAWLAWPGQGREPRASASETPRGEEAPASPENSFATGAASSGAEGNLLIGQAAREVSQLPALEAKLRIQTNMLGQELMGSGSYYQLARAPETLFKLELKLQVANQVSSLLHISDGRFLWMRRDLPTHRFLGRVDQRRIAEALADAGPERTLGQGGAGALSLGGLGRLLETLQTHFDFAPPEDESFGGVPVWVVRGAWKPAALARMVPAQAKTLEAGGSIAPWELPEQMPSHVVVVLSRDPALRLFPYRIDYQREGRRGGATSMVSIDLFDVRKNVSLDPRLFSYKPGDQELVDHTETFLREMGL
jgi:hypothetical protein